MSDDELMGRAVSGVALAQSALEQIHRFGRERPVPASQFTAVMVPLRNATAAVTELERRARGGELVKNGD
jgi:hypothetical protein